MEPKQFYAGSLQEWVRDDDYAYGLWTFKYLLVGPESYTVNCISDAGLVSVILSSTDTANWKAGRYAWFLVREKDGETVHIDKGFVTILENVSNVSAPVDQLTHAEKVLAAIRKRIEERAISDHENYSIDGRSLARIPFSELVGLEKRYAWRVKRERAGRGETSIMKRRTVRLK